MAIVYPRSKIDNFIRKRSRLGSILYYIIKGLDQDVLKETPNENELGRIARNFGKDDFLILGTALGIERPIREQIDADHSGYMAMKMFHLLREWKTNQTQGKPTFQALKSTLEEIGQNPHILCKVKIAGFMLHDGYLDR